MAGWQDIANVWKNVREVDLRPIREEALRDVLLTVIGEPGSGRHTLVEQLRMDPSRPDVRTHTPVNILSLEEAGQDALADLFVIMVEASGGPFERQQSLARHLTNAGKRVAVFYNVFNGEEADRSTSVDVVWDVAHLFVGRANAPSDLSRNFVPVILQMMPEYQLALARQFPLFRSAVAHHLINDTSTANAAYAFSSGLAEIVPVLGLPLNIADMVVLTKAQAFLVYRLGLALGFSTRWQDYVSEFGSVVGSGFIWRQLARSLVGLIPVVGIVPKVAVAYAGTYVVGHVVLRWYLTGRHLSPKQIRGLYRQAFDQGKTVARRLLSRRPGPRLLRRKQAELPPPTTGQACPNCGKSSAADAVYCQYCGQTLPAA
jgi:uncharacterized protein (DUF697 family)